MIGTVIMSNVNGRTLVRNGSRLYIINSGGHYKNEEVIFNEKEALEMPSMLFALSMMSERNMNKAVEFIKKAW